MPIIPAVGAVLGSIGAAAGVTGAGVAAGTSIAAGAAITGAAAAAGIGIAQSAAANAAMKKAASGQASSTPNASQIVGDPSKTSSNAGNLGRAALISTSPSGVLGSDPTGRRKLLGNDNG